MRPVRTGPEAALPSRRVVLAALALFVAHLALLVWSGQTMGGTTDETNYLNAGRIVMRHGWVHDATLFQGPLPLYANQLLVAGSFPPGGYRNDPADAPILRRGRLGTLPFALLSAVLVFLWARSAFGDAGGLLALAFHVANPLMLGYGALLLVDAQHAALVLLVLFLLWRYVETRSLRVLLWLGVALGLALATKYLALLLVPPVVATVVVRALVRAGRAAALPARFGEALLGLFLVGTAALGTLHTCYRFRERTPSTDPQAYRSITLHRALELPGIGAAVKVLPAPFVRGVDFQLLQAQAPWRIFLDGRFAVGHRDYYLRSIAYKTPEVVLVCALALLVLRLPELLRARPRRWVTTLVAAAPYALLALAYLSLFTRMQLGVRYVLPLYPLLFVTLGALARPKPGSEPRAPPAPFFALLAAVLALHAIELRAAWPSWISYFNRSSGGQAGAYRHFRDSNSDFGQQTSADLASLAQRANPSGILGRHSGPRFGRLAVDDDALRMTDPHDRSRPRFDWLTVEHPVAHLDASWYVFECSPEVLEARVASHEDPQLRQALACGYLGEGREGDALRHLAHLDDDVAGPYRRVLELLVRTRGPTDRGVFEELAYAWLYVGRPDEVVELARGHPELAGSIAFLSGEAQALAERRDYPAAVALLEKRKNELDVRAALLLVRYLQRIGELQRAVAVYGELRARLAGDERRDPQLLEQLEDEIGELTAYLDLLQ